MNYILLTLLPLALVRRTQNSSVAAANGQFMLFDTGIYQKLQPHEKFKGNKVEDIAIARYYKSNSLYIDCLTGDETIRCRMYNGFREAITGFSKNITAFFGNSFELAIIFWAITTFGFLFVLYGMQEKIFVLYLVIYFLTRAIVSVISRQSIINNILLAIPQQISIGVFIYRAIMNRVKNYYVWKGRRLS
jgi:hypothetical protein